MSDNELIEDLEVAKFEDDRLGHREIAEHLARLVKTVPTPTNIALYGPWGSGKSGIGNMLAARIKLTHRVKFASFDAFKYAENPLRRNFISVVASDLEIDNPKYHRDLYSGRTTTDFKVPPGKILELLKIFALFVFVSALLSAIAISVVAWLQGRNVVEDLIAIATGVLPASLVPASLLTALIAMVGKTFVVEQRVDRAESDEEFEALLRDLVKDSRSDRVVIFVDELDRCSSADVVETLNAVRTFLGVEKCVFVVAADQQVLERALTESLNQPTPADSVNPYYSAGSAYLDKVFQYQVAVPPLLPQSITSFAVSLVKGRPGVWNTVNIDVIASILIPAHVRSPRRVKNLLNTFALTYRLAKQRQASGYLNVDVDSCVDELARLVCLRVEFPLFARDLARDANLSLYVRELAGPEVDKDTDVFWMKYPYVDHRTREIAEAYANTSRSVDRIIVSDDEDGESETSAEVARVHGQQLLDYLSRTRLVNGPTKALIHLQSSGAIYGLDAAVAEQIERDAQNANLSSILEAYSALDAEARGAVLDLLLQQIRAAVGLEVANIATSILAIVPTDESTLADRADAIAIELAGAVSQDSTALNADSAVGAWTLARFSTRTEARNLGMLVLKSKLFDQHDTVFKAVIRTGYEAVSFDRNRVSSVFVGRLFDEEPADVIDLLLDISYTSRHALLVAASSELSSQLEDSIQTHSAAVKAASKAAAQSAAGRPTPTNSSGITAIEEDQDEVFNPEGLIRELGRLLGGIQDDAQSAEVLVTALLETGERATRDIVERHVAQLAISQPRTAHLVAHHARLRSLHQWPKWLGAIPAGLLMTDPRARDVITGLKDRLWSVALANDPPDETEIAKAAVSVARLLEEADEDFVAFVEETAVKLGDPITTTEDIEPHRRRIHVAEILAENGLASRPDIARLEMRLLATTLTSEFELQEVEAPLAEYVIERVITRMQLRSTTDAVASVLPDEFFEAVAKCQWLSEFDLARLVAIVVALSRDDENVGELVAPSAATVRLYKPDLSSLAFDQLLIHWLLSTREELSEVLGTVRRELRSSPTIAVLEAVKTWTQRLSADDHYAVVAAFVGTAGVALPPRPVLEAIGLARLADGDVVSLLVDRYRDETSNPNRRVVLDLWSRAQLQDVSAREKAIREILIPLVSLNGQATAIALSKMKELAEPVPTRIRKQLGEAVLEATKGKPDLENRGHRVLSELGYKVERKGLFGLRKEVNTSS